MKKLDRERWITRRETHDLIIEYLGDLGPGWPTFCNWTRPSGPSNGSAKPEGFPDHIVVPGSRGFVWDRLEVERWLATVLPPGSQGREG